MELSAAERVRLGAFLLVGGALLLGGLVLLAGIKLGERRDVYTVRYTRSVSGLEPGAQVRYQGLRVGRVENMVIAPDDPKAIEVTLSLSEGTVLYEGTTAVLDLSGITGLKTVNLNPGDPERPVLAPGARIPEGTSLFDTLTGKTEEIAVKVETVANNLAQWTNEENRARFEAVLTNVETLTETMSKTLEEVREPLGDALKAFAESSDAVQRAAIEGQGAMRDVRRDLAGAVSEARQTLAEGKRVLRAVKSADLERSLRAFGGASTALEARLSDAELGRLIENLAVAMADLTRLIQEMDLAVRASREDFVMSMKHVRQATDDLREFSRIIAQDPSILLRGAEVAD